MSALNMTIFYRRSKKPRKVSPFASLPDAMINPQVLELPMSKTNFYGPKDVQVIVYAMFQTINIGKQDFVVCDEMTETHTHARTHRCMYARAILLYDYVLSSNVKQNMCCRC